MRFMTLVGGFRRAGLIGLIALVGIGVSCTQSRKSPTGLAIGMGASEADLAPSGAAQAYAENPVDPSARPPTAGAAQNAANIYGTTSVEFFWGWMPELTYTHESAAGFRKYLSRWYQPNFALRDSGVGVWAFDDTAALNEDNWDHDGIKRGLDSVLVCFHSSHGGTKRDGTYVTWLGSNWSNKGWVARSDRMALGGDYDTQGNEHLRYMFWDTCMALRVLGGRTPMRTWAAQAKGIRMMFGYESPSIDSPNYGQFFWEEWSKNKTMTQAFLDASWRISHDQIPVVLAFGATEADTTSRLDTERLLQSGAVPATCGGWRWYSKSGEGSTGHSATSPTIPSQVRSHEVVVRTNSDGEFQTIAQAMGISVNDPAMVSSRAFGLRTFRTKGLQLVMDRDGDFELTLNVKTRAPKAVAVVAGDGELIDRAKSLIAEFGLAGNCQYQFGVMRYTNTANGTADGASAEPRIIEKTAIFDQVIDGIPFVDPDAGHLEITFDARSGQAKHFRSSLRPTRDRAVAAPMAERPAMSLDAARLAALGSVQSNAAPDAGPIDAQLAIEPGNESVGYMVLDGKATPVYHALLTSAKFPDMRPIEVVVPLAKQE